MICNFRRLILIISLFFANCESFNEERIPEYIEINSLQLIDLIKLPQQEAPHNAFTDLIEFNGLFYICFRSSDKHVHGNDGIVWIYKSANGINWERDKLFEVKGIDLRDPKFSINGDKLSLYIHGAIYKDKILTKTEDYISILLVENEWENLERVYVGDNAEDNDIWPWRILWDNDIAYTFGYNLTSFDLCYSHDGINFHRSYTNINLDSLPTEATIRINKGKYFCLVRRNYGKAVIGTALEPTHGWTFLDTIPIKNFGGPNFIFYNNNGIILGGRETIQNDQQLVISKYNFDSRQYVKLTTLPGGKDLGYPGLLLHDNQLLVSYYATDDIKTSVYFARLGID